MPKALEAFSLSARRWWPAILWMFLILIASLGWASGGTSFDLVFPILRWFDPQISMPQIYDANLLLRKFFHFLQFLILALLVWRTRGSWRSVSPRADLHFAIFVFFLSLALAIGSEYIQSFFGSRSSSVKDVLLNLSGALGGIILALVIELISARFSPSRPKPLKILLTANLLLHDPARRAVALTSLRSILTHSKADLLLIAGNVAQPIYATESLQALKQAAGKVPIALCLGPQDHWLPEEHWAEFPSPEAIRKYLWLPALQQAEITGLDFQNLSLPGLEIVGAYGHFDLGFQNASLAIDGHPLSRTDYLAGSFAGFQSNDVRHIPNAAKTLDTEARLQATTLATRLTSVPAEKDILLLLGTLPFIEWISENSKTSISSFFQAFSGNSLLAPCLLPFSPRIRLIGCGASHSAPRPPEVHGIKGVCMTQQSGKPAYALYDSGKNEITPLSGTLD